MIFRRLAIASILSIPRSLHRAWVALMIGLIFLQAPAAGAALREPLFRTLENVFAVVHLAGDGSRNRNQHQA